MLSEILEELRGKNLLDSQGHEKVDWTKRLKACIKKKISMNQLLRIE